MARLICCLRLPVFPRREEIEEPPDSGRKGNDLIHSFHHMLRCDLGVCSLHQFNAAKLGFSSVGILTSEVICNSHYNGLFFNRPSQYLSRLIVFSLLSQGLLTACLEDYWAAYDKTR